MFPLLFLEGFHAIPCEYVLDPGPARIPHTELKLRFEARDGSVLVIPIEFASPGKTASPHALQEVLSPQIEGSMGKVWLCPIGPNDSVIVTGTKTSPIKSVTVTSDGWKPHIRWVPLPGKK